MYLYYSRVSKLLTLDAGDDGVVLLGPPEHALVLLRSYGLTEAQATAAVVQAVFNMNAPVDLAMIRRITSKECPFFRRNVA